MATIVTRATTGYSSDDGTIPTDIPPGGWRSTSANVLIWAGWYRDAAVALGTGIWDVCVSYSWQSGEISGASKFLWGEVWDGGPPNSLTSVPWTDTGPSGMGDFDTSGAVTVARMRTLVPRTIAATDIVLGFGANAVDIAVMDVWVEQVLVTVAPDLSGGLDTQLTRLG